MKIGTATYQVKRPNDLDAQLLASTGCSPAELSQILGASPIAGTVAQVLLPFLPEKERPDLATLARQISEAGIVEVAAAVRALLGDAAPVTEQAPTA